MSNKINMSLPNEFIKNEQKYWESKINKEFIKTIVPFKRGETKAYIAQELSYTINENISNKILKLCNNSDENIYAFMYSIVTILLFKYSSCEKIVVETNILKQENIANIISERIPLIRDMKEEATFKEILVEARKIISEAYENANYPINKIYDMVSDEKDTTESPLTDVLLILKGLQQEFRNDQQCSKVKITIFIEGNSICLNIEFNKELYSEYYINMLFEHLNNIVVDVCDDINIQVSNISIIGDFEKQELLIENNNTEFTYSKNKTIHQLFEEQVLKTPDNAAVVFDGKSLTYKELNEKANQLAFTLRCKGVKTEVLVGVMLERSANMIIAILAVLKAGGAYLPIDPDYPDDRISYMLQDSQTRLIITSLNLKHKLKDNYEILYVEDNKVYSENKYNLESYSNSKDLAYVIYTSGSTGKSKGVMVEHIGINNLKNTYVNKLKITDRDRIVLFASVSFDASVWEYTMALLNGAQLHVITKDIINNNDYFIDYLNDNEITVATMPPEYLAMLESNTLTTLRLLITAGSAINKKLLDKWSKKVKYVNAYGPTEATICSTIWEYNDSISENQIVPIGKPIYNFKAYILSKRNQIVPIGIPGELCFSGDGLARGYLNNKDLTNEKFIENPYESGERIYKTGDLARWLPDGNLEFLGRIDHQVKIRGYRIELGEVENALLKIEGINDAVVVVGEDQESKYLCAYYISKEEITVSSLRNELLIKLPNYMVPLYFIKVDKFPLNSNGKVDRKLLPKIEKTFNTGIEYEEPQNDVEFVMSEICKEVLGLEKVGMKDNLFEIGADSLKIAAIYSKLKKAKINVSLNDIFYSKNIREIYENCAKPEIYNLVNEKNNEMKSNTILKEESIENIKANLNDQIGSFNEYIFNKKLIKNYAISYIQEISEILNITFSGTVIKFDNGLDLDLFKKSVLSVINSQGLLRSKLVQKEKQIEIHEYESIDDIRIPYIDLSLYSKKNVDVMKEKIIGEIYRENLENKDSIYNKLLYKVIIVKYSENKYKVFLPFNHIIFDAMSSDFIKNALIKAYSNNGELVVLSNALTYEDYIQQIKKGPINFSEDDLIENFKLKEFSTNLIKYSKEFKKSNLSHTLISLKLDDNIVEGMQDILWNISLKLFIKIINFNFNIICIPFAILHSGRRYENKNYYDTLGEFLDIIPLTSDIKNIIEFNQVKNLINLAYNKNINFLALILDKELKARYKKVTEIFESIDMKNINIPVFNYLGLYENQVELEELYSYKSSYKNQEIRTTVDISIKENSLIISTFCKKDEIDTLSKVLKDYLKELM